MLRSAHGENVFNEWQLAYMRRRHLFEKLSSSVELQRLLDDLLVRAAHKVMRDLDARRAHAQASVETGGERDFAVGASRAASDQWRAADEV
jgi:hypothetical protein